MGQNNLHPNGTEYIGEHLNWLDLAEGKQMERERERGSMEADLNYICCCGQRGSCRGASALLEMEAAAAADRVSCSGGCSAPQRLGASVDGRSGARAAPRPPRRPCLAYLAGRRDPATAPLALNRAAARSRSRWGQLWVRGRRGGRGSG